MSAKIINYAIRLLIIGLGVFILVMPAEGSMKQSSGMLNIMGVVMILWGIYRIISYRSASRFNNMKDEDDE